MVSQSLLEPMTTPIWMDFMVCAAAARCRGCRDFTFRGFCAKNPGKGLGPCDMIDITVENFEAEVIAAR